MQRWNGYIELTGERGVVRCEVIPQNDDFVAVYVDEELADDVEDRDYFASEYGHRFFVSLDDYRDGRDLDLDDIWPEG